jgi:hypothetical protein
MSKPQALVFQLEQLSSGDLEWHSISLVMANSWASDYLP